MIVAVVAAGLDSMVLGEPEIQHQVRRAAALAGEEGALRGELRDRPLVCLDLAMPRDIGPAVGTLPGVVQFDVDDLRMAADANRSGRALEARRAEAIVAAEVAGCVDRARGARLARAA